MVTIKNQLVKSRDKTYDGTNQARYITVHETANTNPGADAQAHADLQSGGNVRQASWHIQVDDTEAIRSFPDDVQCWHAGDGQGDGNLHSIGVEICVNADGDYNKAINNAADVVRQLRDKHNIPASHVVQHNHWSGKNCPTQLRDSGRWDDFVKATTTGKEITVSKSRPYFVSPAQGRVTSRWGPRAPLPYHYGIDIAPPTPGQTGHPVYAAYGGKVRSLRRGGGNSNPITGNYNSGSYVLIDGPGGGSEWYGHLASIDVSVGQSVQAGDRLGTMGAVGNVTGIHLHFETWNTRSRSPRNPEGDFKKYGITPGSKPVFTSKASSGSGSSGGGSSSGSSGRKSGTVPNTGGLTVSADGDFGPYTIRAMQQRLRNMRYRGHAVDGDFGYYTIRSLQAFLRKRGQTGHATDGDFGAYTVRSLQRWLRVRGYKGHSIDGDFGRYTITSLQQCLLDGRFTPNP